MIADDTLTAQCLQRLLECEFPGVAILADGQDLSEAVALSKPDVILLGIQTPGFDSFDAIRALRDTSPTTKVMVVTMHDEPEYAKEAFCAGASGYVLKRCAVSEFVTAIRGVLDGHVHLTASLDQGVGGAALNRKGRPNGKTLTLRQREVLQLVAQGCTAKEVANALGLSVKTAVFHKMAIMDKLGLHTTADLTRYALGHGMLSPAGHNEPPMQSTSIPLALTSTSV